MRMEIKLTKSKRKLTKRKRKYHYYLWKATYLIGIPRACETVFKLYTFPAWDL